MLTYPLLPLLWFGWVCLLHVYLHHLLLRAQSPPWYCTVSNELVMHEHALSKMCTAWIPCHTLPDDHGDSVKSCIWALSRQWGKMSFLERQCLSKKDSLACGAELLVVRRNEEVEQVLIFLSFFLFLLLWLKSFLPVSHLPHLISLVWVFQVWRVLKWLFHAADDGIH